ncbi:histidinol-phosphate transaminase [Planococcus lenghuensis]|uniref:Histidinol-phosphate aminotransferase n=1 Tax=Planococcus lenghuensis TaxID=2213202 RepID=A0A1Q2KZR9_9BACL|nr:histidinol-phosphate transaminase [Planococcus lenghuensis]AQQ53624.1 histidinol-phosphate transaminase [Planococcus lenghuensis]
MKWKPQLAGMKAYQPGRSVEEVKKQYGLEEIIKLASNENPFGCSARVADFLKDYALNPAVYPDGYASKLRSAVAAFTGTPETRLLFGSGSDEIIVMITRALLGPDTNTVMASPTFSQYRHNAIIEGAELREVPLTEGKHDLEKMQEAIDDRTAVVWICSPNNPTGVLLSTTEIRTFLKQVSQEVLVVLDEAYFEYITDGAYTDSVALLDEFPNLLILRTFSKAYGLAGFRIGYAIAQEAIIARLDPLRPPFNVTSISQGAAIAALSDQEFIEKCRKINSTGLAKYETFAKKHQLHYYPSQANFILLEVKKDADSVFEELMKRGFIIRSGNALGTPGYIRITVGTEEENDKLLAALEEVAI